MACFRQWFLILSALVLGGGQLFAASREERNYNAAVQQFNDKFYSQAERQLAQFLQTYRKSTNAPNAILLLAQAEFYQKNYPAAIDRLSDPVNVTKARAAGLADRYVYWRAEAQFARGDLEDAARTFVSLTEDFPGSPLALDAVVEAAAAFGQGADWSKVDALLDNTNGLFQRMAQLDPGNRQICNGLLLQAESRCVQQNFPAAIQILNLLNPDALSPEQDWKRAYLLCLANVGRYDLDAALAATTNLLNIARGQSGGMWATNLAESVSTRARILEGQGLLADATAALQENLSPNVPVTQQQQTILKLADLAIAQSSLGDAETALDKYLSQFPGSPAAEIGWLTLGELHLKDYIAQPTATSHLAMAQAKLDQFLTRFSDSPLAGKAYLARGWCDWLAGEGAGKAGDTNTAAGRYAQCLANFSQAAQRPGPPADLAVARFKMGDAQFALSDFSSAQTNYQAVLDDFSAVPQVTNSLASRALYQILRARLAVQDTNGLDNVMQELLGKFFMSAPVESGMLLAGQGFSDFNFPAKARDMFAGFQVERPNSRLMPQVAFAIARTFEREQNWPAAITNEDAWLQNYPASELRPQVEYARAWAVSQTGDEPGAFGMFTNFISQFPASSLTPLAYWWVADHYFRLGGTNLLTAEKKYEMIFEDFPTNELAFRAQLMAGQAALGRFSPTDASHYFKDLINATNCPDDLRDQARFAYCEAERRQITSADTNNAYLQEVTNILAQMTPKAATNIVGAQAWSETGDCDLQLGAFDTATNDYSQVLNSPMASQQLRLRAEVGLGIVLEKKAEAQPDDARKALLDLAMDHYVKAFYSDDETKDAFWTKKAGLQMFMLNAKTGTLKGSDLDAFITRLEKMFPQMLESLEQKRLSAKN